MSSSFSSMKLQVVPHSSRYRIEKGGRYAELQDTPGQTRYQKIFPA